MIGLYKWELIRQYQVMLFNIVFGFEIFVIEIDFVIESVQIYWSELDNVEVFKIL